MKVLFVCAVNPFLFGGGAQATRAYMDAIIDSYGIDNVDVIVCEEAEIPLEYKCVNFIKVPRRGRFAGVLGLLNFQLGRFAKSTYNILNSKSSEYQLCVFNSGRESGWVAKRLKNRFCRFVTIHHNYEVQFCMDTKLFTFGGRFPWLVKKVEKDAYRYSDINLFLTAQDLALFEKEYGMTKARNVVIGTCDFKAAEVIHLQEEKKEFNVAISGSLSDYQTEHGIIDFCENYLQILLNNIPSLKVLLTGRNPSEKIKEIAKSNPSVFTIIASPKDIHKEVRKAVFYICPTDIGGGLKLRAMDSLKNGLPILVHAVSARGYDYFYNKPYFKVYSDKESFGRGLLDILQYLKTSDNYQNEINEDYYKYFGYESGKKRLLNAINNNG